MNKFFLTMVILALAGAGFADDIVAADGSNYKNIVIKETSPLGVTAMVTDGSSEKACWIPYSSMSPADQQKYGYDKLKADEFVAKLNSNKSQMDDGTIVSSPRGQIKDKSIQLPKTDNNPIQGNRFNSNGASGVSPIVSGGINQQTVAVSTPGTYAGVSAQQAAVYTPAANVAVAPSGIGVQTPIGNIGVSPSGIGIQTPVANIGVSPAAIGVQTPIANVSVSSGATYVVNDIPYTVPATPVYPQPMIANTPYRQPIYYDPAFRQPVYANAPVVVSNAPEYVPVGAPAQTYIVYNGAYVPYAVYYGQCWGNNWAYANGVWSPANWYFGTGYGWGGYGWYNPCGYYRGTYWGGGYGWGRGGYWGGRGGYWGGRGGYWGGRGGHGGYYNGGGRGGGDYRGSGGRGGGRR